MNTEAIPALLTILIVLCFGTLVGWAMRDKLTIITLKLVPCEESDSYSWQLPNGLNLADVQVSQIDGSQMYVATSTDDRIKCGNRSRLEADRALGRQLGFLVWHHDDKDHLCILMCRTDCTALQRAAVFKLWDAQEAHATV